MSNEVAELACTYAALILHDDGQDITGTKYNNLIGDKITNLVKAAGVNIEAYWPKLFAKAVEGQDITSFFNFGGAASSAVSAPVTSAPVKEAAKPEAKK